MKVMVIEEFGEPNVFVEKSISKPELKPGHVLIDVQVTSVNAVDLLEKLGRPS